MMKIAAPSKKKRDISLLPGEEILWEDQPNPNIIFTTADLWLMPFHVVQWVWVGFLLLVFGRDAWQPVMLFVFPYLVYFFYLSVGRFFIKWRRKKHSRYTITNMRILIKTRTQSESLGYQDILSVEKYTRLGLAGTLIFDTAHHREQAIRRSQRFMGGQPMPPNTGLNNLNAHIDAPGFYDINGVETAYKFIIDLVVANTPKPDNLPSQKPKTPMFETHLEPDERVIWHGRPNPYILFSRADAFLIPLTLLIVPMAYIWLGGVLGISAGSPFFTLFFTLFVGLQLFYAVIGRFIVKVLRKRWTRYAVTDARVLIRTHLPFAGEYVRSLVLPHIHRIELRRPMWKFGTLLFDPQASENVRHKRGVAAYNTGMEYFSTPHTPAGFFDLAHADKMHDLLEDLRA